MRQPCFHAFADSGIWLLPVFKYRGGKAWKIHALLCAMRLCPTKNFELSLVHVITHEKIFQPFLEVVKRWEQGYSAYHCVCVFMSGKIKHTRLPGMKWTHGGKLLIAHIFSQHHWWQLFILIDHCSCKRYTTDDMHRHGRTWYFPDTIFWKAIDLIRGTILWLHHSFPDWRHHSI